MKQSEKHSKNARTLDMYARLCEGRVIDKSTEALRFGVDERSVQRDIDDIRAFLDERSASDAGESRSVVYDRKQKGFVMKGNKASAMSNSEILAVSKILLESRAFTKQEMGDILDKLIGGCVPDKNKKTVSDLLANEKYHYVELKHKQEFQDILWDFGEDIKKLRRVEISYRRLQEKDHSASQDSSESMEKHYIIEPVGLLFSEYYFYLNAFIVEQNKRGDWKHKYRYPAIFRLDRVISRKDTGETFQVSYKDRFEEGLFRKRTQFMYAGDLLRLKFRYFGYSVDAVLDRLPTAHIVKQEKDSCVIEAEVYGNGIVMWLLSQGSNVEVLKPLTLRNDIKKLLRAMLEQYE